MKLKTILVLLIISGALIGGGYWTVNNFIAAEEQSEQVLARDNKAPIEAQADNDQFKAEKRLLATTNALLLPTEHTPANYIPPKYDPFNNQYRTESEYNEYEKVIPPEEKQPNIPPLAHFTVWPKRQSFADKYSGTVGTEFIFNAKAVADNETASSQLQVRWDFENDGTFDTFFSRNKTARHTYNQAKIYEVRLEVLDQGGAVNAITKQITVVNNTAPTPHFSFKPAGGTTNTVIAFDTGNSFDSQYLNTHLEYRFDWNGDGIWDTKYKRKTLWRHKFAKSGLPQVIMEVKDPEGLTAQTAADLAISQNSPPIANFTVETHQQTLSNGALQTVYFFNAATSSDNESKKLLYRWDFNYTGPDDIIFDTAFSSSPKYYRTYSLASPKTVRLQVKDQDSGVEQTFKTL